MLGMINYYILSSGLNPPSHPHSDRNVTNSNWKTADNFNDKTIQAEEELFISPVFIVFQTFLVVVCVVSLISIAFMAYVIFSTKHLKTVPNILIMNFAFADAYSLIFTPFEVIISPFAEYKSATYMALLYFDDMQYVLKNVQVIFMFLLTIDWCLASYFQEASIKYRDHYVYSIAITWCLAFVTNLIAFSYKILDKVFIVHVLSVALLFLCLLVFVLILQIVRVVKKCRKTASGYPTLSLTVSSVYLTGLSVYLLDAIMLVLSWRGVYLHFLYYLEYLTSTFIFVLLYRNNQDFQSCVRQIMRSKSANEAVRLQDVETNSEDYHIK